MELVKAYPLGRREKFDERSRQYPVRELLGAARKPRSYTWKCGQVLDQKSEGACVGFAWTHELIARPKQITGLNNGTARAVYKLAQTIDEWPGEAYSGTSVLAGVKAVQQLHPKTVKSYRWAFGFDDVIETLGYLGPVVLGVNWYNGMYSPDSKGFIDITGAHVGGHAILAKGVNIKKEYVTLHNSWGALWGVNGECYLSFDNLRRLLKERGEACIIERL